MTELLIHTTWSNLKILLLSKRSQTKRRTFCMIPFTQNSKKYEVIYRDRKQTSGSLETTVERSEEFQSGMTSGLIRTFCAWLALAPTLGLFPMSSVFLPPVWSETLPRICPTEFLPSVLLASLPQLHDYMAPATSVAPQLPNT